MIATLESTCTAHSYKPNYQNIAILFLFLHGPNKVESQTIFFSQYVCQIIEH